MKSLKSKNEPALAAITLLNGILLFYFIQGRELNISQIEQTLGLWETGFLALILAIFTNVLVHLVGREMKDTFVYLRRRAAPAHRIFSKYYKKDPRIDEDKLKKLLDEDNLSSIEARKQNSAWYQIFKELNDIPEILQSHGRWLLFRDMNFLISVFLGVFLVMIYYLNSVNNYVYFWVLIIELILVNLAARSAGITFVQNVVAIALAKK